MIFQSFLTPSIDPWVLCLAIAADILAIISALVGVGMLIYGFGYQRASEHSKEEIDALKEKFAARDAKNLIPDGEADAATWALRTVDWTNDRFWEQFKAMSQTDRFSPTGIRTALLVDLLRDAARHLEDAQEIATGQRVLTFSDHHARECVKSLHKEMEELDHVIVASPNFPAASPTKH